VWRAAGRPCSRPAWRSTARSGPCARPLVTTHRAAGCLPRCAHGPDPREKSKRHHRRTRPLSFGPVHGSGGHARGTAPLPTARPSFRAYRCICYGARRSGADARRRETAMIAVAPVSVIIAVRNGASFLGAAIESVLRQQPRPAEIVVIDGASTDGSVSVAS